MPFTMTHLCIARDIYKTFPDRIGDQPQFYLGTIAPDAVHHRASYDSDFKKASHLCVGDERWGFITNNDEWLESIQGFLEKNKGSDFALGYCVHLLADVYGSMKLWMPFKAKYQNELTSGYDNLYHNESNAVDKELAMIVEDMADFRSYLSRSEPIDFYNLVYADEIDKQKDNILNRWYNGTERRDLSRNKVVTVESIMKFITEAVEFVKERL